jgi:hypothetical protein
MPRNIDQRSNPAVPLERTLGMPDGGPKALPLTLDFSASSSYLLDYTNMQQRNFLDMVQTLFVDNSLSSDVLNITSLNIGQVLKIPAGVQGYFTIIVPNPIKIQFDCADAVVCKVILLNFPVLG